MTPALRWRLYQASRIFWRLLFLVLLPVVILGALLFTLMRPSRHHGRNPWD